MLLVLIMVLIKKCYHKEVCWRKRIFHMFFWTSKLWISSHSKFLVILLVALIVFTKATICRAIQLQRKLQLTMYEVQSDCTDFTNCKKMSYFDGCSPLFLIAQQHSNQIWGMQWISSMTISPGYVFWQFSFSPHQHESSHFTTEEKGV